MTTHSEFCTEPQWAADMELSHLNDQGECICDCADCYSNDLPLPAACICPDCDQSVCDMHVKMI